MTRPLAWTTALAAAFFCTACISISPEVKSPASQAAELARMSEQAVKTCGEGKVKEVSAKSFSCQ
ncbi:hypothetical protein [Inhella crocodyli]|uniref:Entry exclusion lipoprotein TrbK n=1 Tax=Inhella crocodyli TaxID=2499851 RepID=A0A437LQD0_9BURK|nr:hypothetical protein [Inhella crocodyli]RVT87624.1 hypothetical protein EOD73_00930 [Inhella crocodyli]